MFVGDFDFQGQQAETFFDFRRYGITVLAASGGVQPIQPGFVDFQTGIVHQKRFGKITLAIPTAMIQPVEKSVARIRCNG